MSRRRAHPQAVTIAAAGDIHGHYDVLAANLAALRSEIGPIDAVISVGDAEAYRNWDDHAGARKPKKYWGLGTFPEVEAGKINLGAPLYFIGGNHEPWPALDAAGPGRWGTDGVTYLGRAGVTTVAGLRVGYLSGIYSPTFSDAIPPGRREDPKTKTYWTRAELTKLARSGRVDVLVTHEWPAGTAVDWPRGYEVGVPAIRDLSVALGPRLHLCGHMHHPHRDQVGRTLVACLGHQTRGFGGLAAFRFGPDGTVRELTEADRAPVATFRGETPGPRLKQHVRTEGWTHFGRPDNRSGREIEDTKISRR